MALEVSDIIILLTSCIQYEIIEIHQDKHVITVMIGMYVIDHEILQYL